MADGLQSLLATANPKINTLGLETIIGLIPELGNLLSTSELVRTVCKLLVSKQQNTAQLALKAVGLMLQHMGKSVGLVHGCEIKMTNLLCCHCNPCSLKIHVEVPTLCSTSYVMTFRFDII